MANSENSKSQKLKKTGGRQQSVPLFIRKLLNEALQLMTCFGLGKLHS
jgi:hypothetical protein